ncbi:MAG: hypothetical protein UR26_C0002G0137 [candidate division TM6 bacterium GW2011_GWF2_32_72]|nr:MAG: hypothetical protein UR26_C0002G0137 [candidate division TM6 bacterium GW2011_GWF2_32_72]
MKKLFVSLVVILLAIGTLIWGFGGCCKCCKENKCIQKEDLERHMMFVQLAAESSTFNLIKEKLYLMVNCVVKEELGLNLDYDFDFYMPKAGAQRITLYYLNDTDLKGIDFIDSVLKNVLQKNKNNFDLKNVALGTEVNLFSGPTGDQKEELVLMISDPSKELVALNGELKIAMRNANQEYMGEHNVFLYDVEKAEEHTFLPHVGILRIRSGSIKNYIEEHMDDVVQFDQVYARIEKRVLDEAQEIVKAVLSENDSKLKFNNVCLFELPSKKCIKEYKLLE